MILELCEALNLHHSLEERNVFPKLAVKMQVFSPIENDDDIISENPATEHHENAIRVPGYIHEQHRQIHVGLDKLHKYAKNWIEEEKTVVDWADIRGIMHSFGAALWRHMDDEVKLLGAENMVQFWSLEEMKQLPFKVSH